MNKELPLRASEQARFLTEECGLRMSVHTIRKLRSRGADDPRDKGPNCFYDPVRREWLCYPSTLREYAEARKRRMKRVGPLKAAWLGTGDGDR